MISAFRSHRRLIQKCRRLQREAALYAERWHAAELRERKAVHEKERMAKTCASISENAEVVAAKLEAEVSRLEETNQRLDASFQRQVFAMKERVLHGHGENASLEGYLGDDNQVVAISPYGTVVGLDGSRIALGQAQISPGSRAARLKVARRRWLAGQNRSSPTRLVANLGGTICAVEEMLPPEQILSLVDNWQEVDQQLLLKACLFTQRRVQVQVRTRIRAPRPKAVPKSPPPIAFVEQTGGGSAVMTPPRQISPRQEQSGPMEGEVGTEETQEVSVDDKDDTPPALEERLALSKGDEVQGHITWMTKKGAFINCGRDRDCFLSWELASVTTGLQLGTEVKNLLVDSIDEWGRVNVRGPLTTFGSDGDPWSSWRQGAGLASFMQSAEPPRSSWTHRSRWEEPQRNQSWGAASSWERRRWHSRR